MLRLGVLDQSPVRSGATPAEAIQETLALARATDRLGYHRYWLAEHHSTPALAGPSPEVLIPQVAAATPGIPVGPGGGMLQHYTAPEVWLLGSSDQSAAMSAHFGTAFSFAHFINADGGGQITRAYAHAFKPSAVLAEPQASVAVFVVCAPTEEEARRLAQSRDLFIVKLYTGRLSRYPTVAEAEAYQYSPREWAIVEHARRRRIAGTPEQCRAGLEALAAEYGVDEVVVVTITESWETRRRSYELLAGAFGLPPRA